MAKRGPTKTNPNPPSQQTPDDWRAPRFVWGDGDITVEPGISVDKRLETVVMTLRKLATDSDRAAKIQAFIKAGKMTHEDLTFFWQADVLDRPMKEITFD